MGNNMRMSRIELWEAVVDRIDLEIAAEEGADSVDAGHLDTLRLDRKAGLEHARKKTVVVAADGSRGTTYCAVDGDENPCATIEELADKYEIVYSPIIRS